MSESRPVYLGRTTARMLDAASPEVVGTLIKWILAWALRDETPAEIPPALAPLWAVIEDESRTMHDLRADRAAAGRRSGERRRTNANKIEQTGTNANKIEQTGTNANKPEQKEKEKEIENNIRTESEVARTHARVAGKPASVSVSDSASVSVSVEKDFESFDWFACRESLLVPAALKLVGEIGNPRMRGRLGKARRLLGVEQLREILATFAAELRAGEVPANPGATLNARLSAREACQ